MSTQDAIAFIHDINNDEELQQAVWDLTPRDWSGFVALAQKTGYVINHAAFMQACVAPEIKHFCDALDNFAGSLWTYKM